MKVEIITWNSNEYMHRERRERENNIRNVSIDTKPQMNDSQTEWKHFKEPTNELYAVSNHKHDE